MIKINNLTISFKQNIIKNSQLKLYENEITLITGISGTGKSSILNVLALIDQSNQCDYLYQSKKIEDKNLFKNQYISYVFQDGNIIDDYTIKDHFVMMYNMVGKKYDSNQITELMSLIHIDIKQLSQKCKSLSIGEKQRLSIALALIKDPIIILLDEPTASLDQENASDLIQLLYEVKNQGKIIVIATHHPHIYNADHIYRIENKRVIEDFHQASKISLPSNRNGRLKRKNMRVLSYSYIYLINHPLITSLLVFVFIFSLSFIINLQKRLYDSQTNVNEIGNKLPKNEIIILDDRGYEESNGQYLPDAHQFSTQEIDRLISIDHVDSYFPYYFIQPSTHGYYFDAKGNIIFDDSYDQLFNVVTYQNQNYNLYDQTDIEIGYVSTNNEKMMNRCSMIDPEVEEGVYISSDVASILGIEKLDHTTISINLPVQVGMMKYKSYYMQREDELNNDIESDPIYLYINNYTPVQITIEIKGIYELVNELDRYYSAYSFHPFYFDYHYFEKMHDQIINDDQYKNAFMNFYSLLEDIEEYSFEMNPSMIVLMADELYQDQIINEINQRIDGILIKTKDQDTGLLQDVLAQGKIYFMKISLSILICMIILLSIFNYHRLNTRKKEITILKVNGVKHIPFLISFEYFLIMSISSSVVILLAITKNQFFSWINNPTMLIRYFLLLLVIYIILWIETKLYCIYINDSTEIRKK